MCRPAQIRELSDDAIAIWQAAVRAVDAESLVRSVISIDREFLTIAGEALPCERIERIAVVGAGKAGAGMAAGFEHAIGASFLRDRLTGWVNVPADCIRPAGRIHLHAARPAGVNEPTAEGVAGAHRILQIVSELTEDDVCVVLLSGGGSALLPAPVEGVTLEGKQQLTRGLMQAGARIDQLNTVRTHLSQIKGGRLADACRAGVLITLIISDVIGDPLNVIASGPTVADRTTPAEALETLELFSPRMPAVPESVIRHLQQTAAADSRPPRSVPRLTRHVVIGNIELALAAAADEGRRRGYPVRSLGGANAGIAKEVGVELAEQCLAIRDSGEAPLCLLSGGEPTVELAATDRPRSGGRNQELVLAAADRLFNEDCTGIVVLSGGTDGEDGPTDAAGAWIDAEVLDNARQHGLRPRDFLAINNSYAFFAAVGGHLKTGPTHTNVMDLRVCLIDP